MFATSILVLAAVVSRPAAPAEWPPRTTVAELNAMVKAGNYHLVRKQKVAHQIEAVGVVETVGRWPLLKLQGGWQAVLHNVPPDHGLKPGDHVRFRALIVDEAYHALQLWAYSWGKEPAGARPPTADGKERRP
jgi:hypothetical protein